MARTRPLLLVLIVCSWSAPAEAQRRSVSAVVTRTRPVEVQFTVADDVRVRTNVYPAQFDDKGHLRKLSRDEILKLKGDTPEEQRLAGYKWDFGDLKRGDEVQVVLSAHAGDAKTKAGKGDVHGTRWIPKQKLTGTVKAVAAGDAKTLTLQVSVTSKHLLGSLGDTEGAVTIAPEEEQATMIVVLKESELPPPKTPPGKPNKKKQ